MDEPLYTVNVLVVVECFVLFVVGSGTDSGSGMVTIGFKWEVSPRPLSVGCV